MKIVASICSFCFLINFSMAQNNLDSLQSIDVNISISTFHFAAAKEYLNTYISFTKPTIIQRNETRREIHVDFKCTLQNYLQLEPELNKMGFIENRKIQSTNTSEKKTSMLNELTFVSNRMQSYEELLKTADNKSAAYITIWNELKILEERKFKIQNDLLQLQSKENLVLVQLSIVDYTSRDNDDEKVYFINMPGIEYNYLMAENSLSDKSSNIYTGIGVKYLFTKGKTYAGLGLYKNQNYSTGDLNSYSELFSLHFGQDFYSRYLGRGTRKFINLYSTYSLGAIFATSPIKKSSYLFVSPGIGIEWYKNNYILIDTKASYMVPLDIEINLRGILMQGSFNFVF